MERTLRDSSPLSDLKIKVQPRQNDPDPLGGIRYHRHHPPQPQRVYSFGNKWFPWLVPTIVITNIVMFVISMYINNCPDNSNSCIGVSILGRFSFQNVRDNPLLGPSSATLQKIGALESTKVVEEHEIWRLATCMWLHAGVVHVLLNMVGLLFVGFRLEEEFGFVRIGLLYIISGFGASLLSSLFVRSFISVGASGALFGLLGAMLSELIANWTIYENKLGSLLCLILIIFINMAVGILPHVDNFAHIGGFLTGFLLGFVLLLHPQYGWVKSSKVPTGYGAISSKPKYKAYQYVFLVVSLLLLLIGFAIGCIFLLQGVDGNEYCSWCHYLCCVPTPLWNCEARCSSSQYENQLNLTCMQTHKSKFYLLDNNTTASRIQKLCVELCG